MDDSKERRSFKYEIENIPSQKPNRKTLGLARIKLALYNSIDTAKEKKKFYNWLKYKVGEAPVLFDTATCTQTLNLLKNYMVNKGYFQNQAFYTVSTKNKKTEVIYEIKYDSPYTLWDIHFPTDSSATTKIIQDHIEETFLKFNAPFDVTILKSEMDRISTDLRNQGYYYINRDKIFFDLDTSVNYKHINITVRLLKPDNGGEHKEYNYNNVVVYTNYNLDTKAQHAYLDSQWYKNVLYLTDSVRKFNRKRLDEYIFTRKTDKFSQTRHEQSVRRMVNLGVFKFVNTEIHDVSDSVNNLLDIYYFLTPARKQRFSVDFDQNYSNLGRLGSNINFSYKNRNLTKNTDQLSIVLNTGIQFVIKNQSNPSTGVTNTNLIYQADFGGEIAYTQNRFLVPFPIRKQSYNSNPKTRISAAYNFQKIFGNYSLHRVNLKYGFEWRTNTHIRNQFNLIDLSLLTFRDRSALFEQRLAQTPSLRYSYSQGIIPSTNYTFYYLGQKDANDNQFINYTFSADVAGNLFYGISKLIKNQDAKTNPYQIFKTQFSQYIRFESDLRGYLINADKSALVGRLYGGIGIPYGNSQSLPFIRQFYVGGGNSVRAFTPNTVGPGSYADPIVYTNPRIALQSGDVKLEANIEYRFNIYRWFKGALFADAGNVWLLRKDTARQDAEFRLDKFFKQLAIGTGAGIRADFDFFVLRFDVGIPLYDPREPEKERWLLNRFTTKKIPDAGKYKFQPVLNLAIGYPF